MDVILVKKSRRVSNLNDEVMRGRVAVQDHSGPLQAVLPDQQESCSGGTDVSRIGGRDRARAHHHHPNTKRPSGTRDLYA